jgi:hypothetical protein
MLFVPGNPLVEDMPVFFWQRYNNYLLQLQCLILILVPIGIVLGLSSLPKDNDLVAKRRSALLTVVFLSFSLCLVVNYFALFISGSVTSIGTVRFRGHVYHLARHDKYDDPSRYYLGECDRNGYRCVFHKIYQTFMMEPGPPQITLGNDPQLIIVKMGNDTVYTYDGEKGHCNDVLLVQCSDSEAPP